jgi:hypothetical protein
MPSGIKTSAGADLDTIFAPRGSAAKGADVGFIVANGDGVQGDISNRYFFTAGGDLTTTLTGLRVGTSPVDLASFFRRIDFVVTGSGPIIVTQPTGAVRVAGASVSLTVSATGTGSLTYLWQRSPDGAAYATAPGASTSATYTISATVAGDQGYYRCVVTDSAGSATSSTAALVVNYAPAVAAAPASGTVNSGNAASFAVGVTQGQPADALVVWQRRLPGGAWAVLDDTTEGGRFSGASSTTLSFLATPADHNSDYRAVVSNSAGSATSASANLLVNYVPIITGQPLSASGIDGDSFSLAVSANAFPSPSYQWQKDTGTWTDVSGATSSAFTKSGALSSDSGEYRCQVTNSRGTTTSSTSTVVIHAVVAITGQPVDVDATVGDPAFALTVTATGDGPLTYTWYRDGALLVIGSASHVINPTVYSVSGNYYCRVGGYGPTVQSNTVRVTVVDTPIVVSAAGTVNLLGPTYSWYDGQGDANFYVTVTSGSGATFVWKKGASVLGAYVTAQGPQIPAAAVADSGTYSVEISNHSGALAALVTVTASAVLDVQPTPAPPPPEDPP